MRSFKMLFLYSAFLYFIGHANGHNIDLQKAPHDIEKLLKYLLSLLKIIAFRKKMHDAKTKLDCTICKNSKDKSQTNDTEQIFAQLLDSFKEEGEKKLLFSQIVPMFEKMFDSVKATEVKDSITNLSQMLHNSHEDFLKPTDHKIKLLLKLKEMQVSDIKIQQSAIKILLRILTDIHNTFEQPKKPNPPKCKRESRRRRRGC